MTSTASTAPHTVQRLPPTLTAGLASASVGSAPSAESALLAAVRVSRQAAHSAATVDPELGGLALWGRHIFVEDRPIHTLGRAGLHEALPAYRADND